MGVISEIQYPIVAIGDVHGQYDDLRRLIAKLRPWKTATFVFLGDFVDRNSGVYRVIDLVLSLPRFAAVAGNHDIALVRAAGLDGRAPSPYWTAQYLRNYDSGATFASYGVSIDPRRWRRSLDRIRDAMPDDHARFLASLPWAVESSRHVFLHCGLSRDLGLSPDDQLAAIRDRDWRRSFTVPGTISRELYQPHYPPWVGSDRRCAIDPLPYPSKTQVTGHVTVHRPLYDRTRIRIDTSGGFGQLTACVLESPESPPRFVA